MTIELRHDYTSKDIVPPYYEGSRATLYVGDCREIATTLPRHSIDLLIADPPYGVSWQSGYRTEKFDRMAGDDGLTDWPAVIGDVVRRLVRNNRHIYVFGYEPDQVAKPLQLGATAELIWDKGHLGTGNLAVPWGPEHERITFGVYDWSNRNRGRLVARLRQGSVIQARRANSGQVRHPDEKPVTLLRQLIESSSCYGETILDPVCGVGSTLVAAVLAGRKAIGIELEPKYADVAVERLRKAERLADLMEASDA